MTSIRKMTEEYVTAFNARDLDKVANYLADDFKLSDTEISELTPKGHVLKYIKELFDTHKELRFVAQSIHVDGNTSVIHFTLTLDAKVFDGVDIILWANNKMVSMHAYLTLRK